MVIILDDNCPSGSHHMVVFILGCSCLISLSCVVIQGASVLEPKLQSRNRVVYFTVQYHALQSMVDLLWLVFFVLVEGVEAIAF